MNEWLSKEDYSFAEYLYDKRLIKSIVDIVPEEVKGLWPAEGANYVQYCKDNDYYFEKIGDY